MIDLETPPVGFEQVDGTSLLRLAGSINLSVAADLYSAAIRALDAGGRVVIECGLAEYLDVAALQVLVALKRALDAEGRSFALSAAPAWLDGHLRLTGLQQDLCVAPSP